MVSTDLVYVFTEILLIDLWSFRTAHGVTELVSCVGDHITDFVM